VTTFDSPADPRPLVGLIELPDLAELLTACGLNVVTGPDFRTAATAIRDGFQSAGAFPLITADINAPGLRPWLGTISKVSTAPIAIVRGAGAPALEVEGAIELALPFTVDAFLASLGMPAIGGAAGAAGYPAGSAPARPAAPVQMQVPDFDDFAEPAPRQAPAAPAPAAAVDEDPFGAPAPSRRAARAAAPVEEDWDTPVQAPAPAAQEMPSRRARRAAEVEQPAPAPVQDDWDTPAPAAPQQQYAQQQYEQPSAYAAPAAPVHAQPAPAFQAPAPQFQAPVQDDWDTPAPAQYAPPAPAAAAPQYAAPEFDAPAPPQYRQPAPPAAEFAEDPFQAPAPAQYRQPVPAPAPEAYAPPAPQFDEAFQAPAPQYAAPAQYAPPAQAQYAAPAPQYAAPAPEEAAYQQPPRPQEFFDTAAPVHSYPAPVEQRVPYAADREAAAFFTQSTPVPAPRQGAPLGFNGAQPDSSGIFDDFEASRLQGTGRSAAGLASFIISYSGKGGVGKSTASLQMAHKAAAAGLKVVLIDGNSGQGDLRTYLRLNRTDLPTIYDAAIGPIKNAILTPDVINRHREQNLGEVKFAFIAAPPDDINDPDVVTHDVYRRVIEFARRNSDLVIMDTQIIESADRTGVVTQLILPALVHDAWGVGVTDMTNVGVNNLNNRLRKFLREEVPIDRLMVMINRVHPEQLEMASKATTYFHDKATFLGSVEMDAGIGQDMNAGRINIANAQLGSIMSKILLRVTGNEFFRPEAEGAAAPSAARTASGRKAKPALASVPKPAGEKFNIMDLISRFLPGKKAA
jgi:Mrp family chromosome partitioning ATPase